MLSPKLNEFERSEYLPELKDAGWEVDTERDAIKKTYQFKNFIDAMGWMTRGLRITCQLICWKRCAKRSKWFGNYCPSLTNRRFWTAP